MFKFLRDKVAEIIGNEAERQNAIARFGTGIAIDRDGNVADPRDPTKKIHIDDFGKLPAADRMKAIVPAMERLIAVPQLRPEDLTARGAADLLKSALTSDDQIGKQMRGEKPVTPGGAASTATPTALPTVNGESAFSGFNTSGPLMTTLKGGTATDDPKKSQRLGM